MSKKKHLEMTTKASTVFLKDGDTSYTISLDGLDMALLPMDKLLNKYSGNQQTAIWSLDTYSKDFEYLNEWDDEFCQFEVEAMKRPDCHFSTTRMSKKKHLEMTTKASTVFLKDGDTSYTISLDGLDMALLPMDKLLNKYSGNQQTAIWSLDTYSKDFEYLNEWDNEFCQFEVEAMKRPEPMKNCIFCYICQINVPKTHIEEHNDSEGHSAMLKMAFRAADRTNKHMMQEKNSDSLINVPSEEQSYYYCAPCNMFVDLSDTNHHNEVEHRTSLKRHKLYSKIYEKYEQLGEEENRNETIDGLDVTKKTDLKDTHESQGLNTKPSNKENIEINKQSDQSAKCDNKSKSRKVADRYCRVCDIYVPNTKYNLKEHYNGKTHKSNLVANENQLIETASETGSADVLVTKSDLAMSNTNSVATASATRNDTTVHSNQTNDAEKLFLLFIDLVNSPAIKIFDKSGVSILVTWWSWHGFKFSHDFYDSGYINCELCEIHFPFEHIYGHVTDKSHKHSTATAAHQVYNGMRGLSSCLVCNTKENAEDHQVSSSHIKNLTEAIRLANADLANEGAFPQLTNEEIERQILSSNSLRYIKPYLQKYIYPPSKLNKFCDEFGIYEVIDIFTKSGEMIQLWKINYHSLKFRRVRFREAFGCLLCKQDVLPEHAWRHVSSKEHLDRVEIPFTDEENCIRRFEYSPMKFGYHCAHCNLGISTDDEVSRHVVYCISHENRLKMSIFQRCGGEWRLKEEIRLRTEWLQKTKKGGNKGKWLCLVIIGAVLTYGLMKARQIPTPTEVPTSYGNHFMHSMSLFDCS